MNWEELNQDKVSEIRKKVEIDSESLEKIVDEILNPYMCDLDKYVDFIRGVLTDYNNPPSAQELDDMCLNLAMYIYYAGTMQERLGIRDDISRAIHKEMFNNARQAQDKGTVQDKTALAELASQHEEVVSMVYKRCYTIAKSKVQAAQELLSSIKKVISRRLAERELSNFTGGN